MLLKSKYSANLVRAGLIIPDTRIIAQLMLAGVSGQAWHTYIVIDNILQTKTCNTSLTYASLARCRLNTMTPELWTLVAEGSLTVATYPDPVATIRRYISKDFYKNHCQMYKKRPIYWLFSSGKEKAFECLVYLHRYNEGTLSRMRMEYVVPLQSRILARIDQREADKVRASSGSEQKKLQKEQDQLKKQLEELRRFDEELRPFADKRITLDLDDGVKVNYGKFGALLADVKAITGGKEE